MGGAPTPVRRGCASSPILKKTDPAAAGARHKRPPRAHHTRGRREGSRRRNADRKCTNGKPAESGPKRAEESTRVDFFQQELGEGCRFSEDKHLGTSPGVTGSTDPVVAGIPKTGAAARGPAGPPWTTHPPVSPPARQPPQAGTAKATQTTRTPIRLTPLLTIQAWANYRIDAKAPAGATELTGATLTLPGLNSTGTPTAERNAPGGR